MSHGSPPTLAFFLDGALGSICAKIVGNDGAGSLHVQEVRGQGSLGSIRVVLALLALLLLLALWHQLVQMVGKPVQTSNHGGERGATSIVKWSRLSNEQVGLTKEVIREILHETQDGRKSSVDLGWS